MMPPIYGLEMGDADCYCHNANRGERHTLDALQIADGYVDRQIPLGWMLVNDGYGCGYENLDAVAQGLHDRHITLGLWTSTGLADHAQEVRTGARVRKLDVAWVGPGYRFALNACRQAYEGIENHSEGRGFVWTPEGWAGSQRYAVHWSGDQEGSWEYIRWQIPTYAGATLSGLASTTGDVDGIYTGSAATYTRDLQWKMFLPVVMTMSGWAPTDKQPWRWGEPYTAINRRYIQLRERLLPYFYTYAARAHRSGVGMVRPLWLEYPDDPATVREEVKYEFLAGDAFLVAPVYDDREVRDSIYLPEGTWVDYWTGERHRGPVRLHDHPAPLDRLPLFVKGGSIVPMWPEGTLSWKTRDTGQLDLDVYPDDDGNVLHPLRGRRRDPAVRRWRIRRADVHGRVLGGRGLRDDRRNRRPLRRPTGQPPLPRPGPSPRRAYRRGGNRADRHRRGDDDHRALMPRCLRRTSGPTPARPPHRGRWRSGPSRTGRPGGRRPGRSRAPGR